MPPSAGGLQLKGVQDAVAVLPYLTDAVAHSVNGVAVFLPRPRNAIVWELDITAAAAEATDTLDVWLQTMCDGVNWVDVVHFTQMLGNGGTKRYFDKIVADAAQAEFENGAALAASSVRHLMGDQWRVRYTIASAGTPFFRFGVFCVPM